MVRVLIADDHAILRRGLKEILTLGLESATFGEAGNAEQVLGQLEGQEWGVLLLDINMPGRSGLEVLHDVRRIRPSLPVLILSMYPEQEYGKKVLSAGASGYLRKDCDPDELVSAIQQVISGQRYISPALAEHLEQDAKEEIRHPSHEILSNREMEVLRGLGSGRTVGQIAEELKISVATVSTYRARILEKMDMSTTAQLMHYALRNHLVD